MLLGLAIGCWCLFGQSGPSLKGVVKNESGNALVNAQIVAVPDLPPGVGVNRNQGKGPGTSTTVLSSSSGTEIKGKTDGQGNFNLQGIPAGKYTICVQDLDNKHLDPCFWSAATHLDMSNGKDVSNHQAQVTSAATLQVRVEDPLRLSDPRVGEFETLVAVVLPDGRLAPMNLVTSEASGKTFQLAVPTGNHKVAIKSSYFTIVDGKGKALNDQDAGNGFKALPTVDAPVSISKGMSYVAVTITGKR
jgi:hypothetical protein